VVLATWWNIGLWPDNKHNSTAQIAQIGSALVWDSVTLSELLDAFPQFSHNTFRVLEERLQEIEQRFRELSSDDVPSRLSSELIRLSRRFGPGIKENGEIHLSQTDLAQLTGTRGANRKPPPWPLGETGNHQCSSRGDSGARSCRACSGFRGELGQKTVLGNGQTQKASANDAFPNLNHPRSAPVAPL